MEKEKEKKASHPFPAMADEINTHIFKTNMPCHQNKA
jgi:hypothetical protein